RDGVGGGGGGGGSGGGRAAAELGSSVTLTDSVGQRVEVLLENRLGEGGQRNVTVYCPVWMVNTSHYRLRYRQDGQKQMPAGTVSKAGDGQRPIYDNDCMGQRDSRQSSCFGTPVRGESNSGSTLPPWVIPNARTPGSFSSPSGGAPLPTARHLSHRSSLATGALSMTALLDGNINSKSGDGASVDLGGNRSQRDGGEGYGGVHTAGVDRLDTSGSGAESAGRRESTSAQRHAASAGRGR
ncbi:unnamed protein product, partial [Hapterophycus canaliculatus]